METPAHGSLQASLRREAAGGSLEQPGRGFSVGGKSVHWCEREPPPVPQAPGERKPSGKPFEIHAADKDPLKETVSPH